MQPPRPTRATIDMSPAADGTFDQDAYAVMNTRDNALIESEILYGQGSSKFVYQFSIGGSGSVSGISVVGARHLAAHYGGIRHKLIGSMQKQGALFTFTSFPQQGVPMAVSCQVVPELADEDDFYGAIVEVTDTKSGNVVQVEKRENRYEKKRDGSYFERPHFAIIAQSKAYRNAVLSLIPQDIQVEWRESMLKLDKADIITGSILDEKRAGVLRFATSKGLMIHRLGVDKLTMDQIAGLSDAAREGVLAFKVAALSAGILRGDGIVQLPQHEAAPAATSAPMHTPAPTDAPKPTPAPTEAPRATPAPTSAPTPKPTPAPTEGPRELPKFAEMMADQFGEMVMDGDDAMLFTDPGAFALHLSSLVTVATPGDRKLLFDNNQEAVWLAAEISDAAKSIIDSWRAVAPLPTSAPAVGGLLVIPMKGDRQDFIAYTKAVKAALADLPSMAAVDGWIELNGATIAKMPTVARRQVEKAILDRQGEIQPHDEAHGNAPSPTESPVPTAAPQDHRDELTCQGFLADIANCRTFDDVIFWSKQAIPKAVVRRWMDERPDLFAQIDAAVIARKPVEE